MCFVKQILADKFLFFISKLFSFFLFFQVLFFSVENAFVYISLQIHYVKSVTKIEFNAD